MLRASCSMETFVLVFPWQYSSGECQLLTPPYGLFLHNLALAFGILVSTLHLLLLASPDPGILGSHNLVVLFCSLLVTVRCELCPNASGFMFISDSIWLLLWKYPIQHFCQTCSIGLHQWWNQKTCCNCCHNNIKNRASSSFKFYKRLGRHGCPQDIFSCFIQKSKL